MKKLFLMMALALFSVNAWAGDESLTQALQSAGNIQILQLSWGTDGSGNFTATNTAYNIDGYVLMCETDPDATAAPTDNYDITLKNAQGVDVMGGALSNRDTSNTELTMPLLNGNYTMIPVSGPLTFDVTSAGNDKDGVLRIYFIK